MLGREAKSVMSGSLVHVHSQAYAARYSCCYGYTAFVTSFRSVCVSRDLTLISLAFVL